MRDRQHDATEDQARDKQDVRHREHGLGPKGAREQQPDAGEGEGSEQDGGEKETDRCARRRAPREQDRRCADEPGFLDRLDGGHPQWDPGGVALTRTDATHWTITFTGREGTQLEYKYTLGDWDHVEKDGACGEVANRALTLSYGSDGTQTVNDEVPNWRNVAPCGN